MLKYLTRGTLLSRVAAVLFIAALVFTGCEQAPGPGPLPVEEQLPSTEEETSPEGETPPEKENPPKNETPVDPGTDAALKSLEISAGNLDSAFSPAKTDYTASVGNAVDSIRVTGVPRASVATVGGDNGTDKALEVGENPPITIVVTAGDGVTKRTYTVTVTRLPVGIIFINSAEDMAKIGIDSAWPLAGTYKLAADITLENWVPIGTDSVRPFTGSFDGDNRKITLTGFDEGTFGRTGGEAAIGIFGYVRGTETSKALIRNLNVRVELVKTISEKTAYYVGAVTGYADEYTEMDTITVEGSLDFSNTNTAAPKLPVFIGGITGALIASELKNSAASADITGSGRAGNGAYNYVGGLVGMFDRNAAIPGMNPAPVTGVSFTGASITNSHNTGTVSGSTEGGGTNVFVGGITGGSRYGMKTYYSGKIEDCYSTGNITASGGGFWSWAGGIAGTICGDGHDNSTAEGSPPATGPTRIVRCYATGVITGNSPSGGWPYVGGIVGYNYYGSLVSQCWFDGTVNAEGGGNYFDYTGGIAGYNSKEYGHSSRIEDCWSAGFVNGRINAGGIVGQNQVAAITERCYSRSALSVRAGPTASGSYSQQGMGGIAGYSAVADSKAEGSVRNCVALNPSLTAPNGFNRVYRIIGDGGGILVNNLANSGMAITISGNPPSQIEPGPDTPNGADCAAKPEQSVYEGLDWDFTTVWKMGGDGYPVLQWQQ
jgi:hypothetical protein